MRRVPLAQDQLGRAPSDVHHQSPFIAVGQQVRNTQVNQAGFFSPGDHLDGKAQCLARLHQKRLAVARLAQGLGGHRAHLAGLKVGDALGKAGQAGQSACHRLLAQIALGIQAIALPDRFLEVFHAAQVAVFQTANFQSVAVGAQVNGGKKVLGLHGVKAVWPRIM